MLSALIGTGTYLIVNHTNNSKALQGGTSLGDIIDTSNKSLVNYSVYSALMNRLGSRTGGATTLENGGSAIVFTMAGHDWQVVYRDPANSDIITVWMTEPYITSTFGSNKTYSSSTVRTTVNDYYNTQVTTYTGMSSFIRTPSQMSSTYQSAQAQNGSYGGYTSDQGALGGSENFWLPSLYEAFSLWELDANDRGFDDTGVATYCWLRSGYSSGTTALRVTSSGVATPYSRGSVSVGVRPAAHISLSALEAALPPQYTISVTSNNTVYGTVSTSGGTYDEGTTISVIATPNPNYQFVRWECNGVQVSTNTTYEITVSGNDTYTAVFEPIMHTVTTAVYPAGVGTIQGGGSYQQGTQATITASVTNSNYKFIGWDTNGDNLIDISATNNNPYNFTVSNSITITAIFEPLLVIHIINTQIENVYAISNSNYAFLYWLDLATGQRYTANPLSFTITQNTTITAVFGSAMADGVAVSVESLAGETSAIGEARITGYSNINGIEYVHFSAVAYKGYSFIGWYIMGEESPISTQLSADLSLAQVQNKIVIARFEPQPTQDNTNSETDNT